VGVGEDFARCAADLGDKVFGGGVADAIDGSEVIENALVAEEELKGSKAASIDGEDEDANFFFIRAVKAVSYSGRGTFTHDLQRLEAGGRGGGLDEMAVGFIEAVGDGEDGVGKGVVEVGCGCGCEGADGEGVGFVDGEGVDMVRDGDGEGGEGVGMEVPLGDGCWEGCVVWEDGESGG
jgi:hypothetical protein